MSDLIVCDAPQTSPTEQAAFPIFASVADRAMELGTSFARQTTLARPISCVGQGLHSGAPVRLTLNPAPAETGIVFRRTDLTGCPTIEALYSNVSDTRLSTVLSTPDNPQVRVATVEHLMAALHGNGIDNALIDIDGPETPILDGSAAEFDFLIQCAGRDVQAVERRQLEILKRVRVEGENGAFAELRPARRGLALALTIDFEADAIGRQNYAMPMTEARFRQDVANCRTFVEKRDIDALQKAGLARGGSLDNAIVVDNDTILNPGGLRRPGEFVRHKAMDAIGDLYLAGRRLQAGFMGHKSGHTLNNRLLRALFADSSNWRLAKTRQASTLQQAA